MKKWSIELPHISEKQKEIMLYIYKFRFLDRKQIQALMKHKDYKRINIWLKDLTNKGYLFRKYEQKFPKNLTPAIYYAAPIGVRFLKREFFSPSVHKLYREKDRSEKFINHCLFITKIYFDTIKSDTVNQTYRLNYFHTKSDICEKVFESEDEKGYSDMITPYPDAIISFNKSSTTTPSSPTEKRKAQKPISISKQLTKKDEELQLWMEIIDEGVPRFYLKYRINQYLEYFDSQTYSFTLRVGLICPDERTRKFLNRFITNTFEETLFTPKIAFMITTHELAQKEGSSAKIWDEVEAS